MKILGTISELVKVILRKSTYEVTVQPSTVTADTTFELPAAGGGTKAIVTADSSATLTNKIIDGDNNTVQNLPVTAIKTESGDANKALVRDGAGMPTSALLTNSNVAAAAGIVYSKLSIADGDLSIAKTSGLQTALDSKVDENAAITGATNTKITYDAKGLVTAGAALAASDLPTGIDAAKIADGSVTSTEFQTLSDIDTASTIQAQLNARVEETAGTLNNATVTDFLDITEQASNPAAPASSAIQRLFSKASDGKLYKIDSGSIVSGLGGGGLELVVITSNTAAVVGKHYLANTSGGAFTITLPLGSGISGGDLPNATIRISDARSTFDAFNLTIDPAAGDRIGSLAIDENLILDVKESWVELSWDGNRWVQNDAINPLENSGASSGATGRNYLADFYTAERALDNVENNVPASSGSRVSPGDFGSSSTSNITIAQSSVSPLRETYSYLTSGAGAGALAGTTFIESPMFALDTVDLGKALSITFDVSGVATDNNMDVVVARYNSSNVLQGLIPVAGNASTATATPSAKLPTGISTFRGFFISSSTSGDKYSLRFRRLVSADNIKIDSLAVGPNSIMTGTAITDQSRSYVPTITGVTANPTVGTTTTNIAYYRQVGDKLEFNFNIIQTVAGTTGTGTYLISLPSGLTIDTTKLPANSPVIGSATIFNATNRAVFGVQVYDSTRLFLSGIYSAGEGDWGSTFYPLNNATLNVRMFASVPIVGWSSNVTMADRAVEEFASNGGAAGVSTSDTADFKYGPAGSQIGSITAQISRRVRFQTVVQATDSLIVEVSTDRIIWSPMNNTQIVNGTAINPYNTQSSVTYGYGRIAPFSSTDVDIAFGQYAQNAGAYAGAGTAWSSGAGSGYWRVRKVSSGAAVGYPIGARNVIGDTTGTAVPAGYIGEKLEATITSTFTQTTPAAQTIYDVTGLSISVPPGVWAISASGVVSASSANTSVTGVLYLRDGANNNIQFATGSQGHPVTQFGQASSLYINETVVVSSTTTYKVSAANRRTTGTVQTTPTLSVSVGADYSLNAYIRAVRIA